MTKKSETQGFTASKFASTLLGYLGLPGFDAIVCNSAPINESILAKYKKEHAEPVVVDKEELAKYSKVVICDNIADQAGCILRHNAKTASIIARL